MFGKGEAFHTKFFVVFFRKAETTRAGFIASKKVGKATVRNRAKRRLKALFRELSYSRGGDFVLVARAGIEDADYNRLKKDLDFALKKLLAKKPKKGNKC